MRSVSREALANWGLSVLCYNFVVCYVYILQLEDKTYYHGFSADLKNRLENHKNGSVSSTKNLLPFKLIFYAAFSSKEKATQFEKYLKSSSGFAFRNKHLL